MVRGACVQVCSEMRKVLSDLVSVSQKSIKICPQVCIKRCKVSLLKSVFKEVKGKLSSKGLAVIKSYFDIMSVFLLHSAHYTNLPHPSTSPVLGYPMKLQVRPSRQSFCLLNICNLCVFVFYFQFPILKLCIAECLYHATPQRPYANVPPSVNLCK